MPEETADARTEEAAPTAPEPAASAPVNERTEPEPTTETAAPAEQRALPRKLVFRTPASAYVVIAFLALCVSFVAVAAPYLTVVYLLPLGALAWVVRTRTEVDADRLVVRRVLTRTVVPWSRVASLRLVDKGWIRAVRTRHLPALALISGGRLADPTDPAAGT